MASPHLLVDTALMAFLQVSGKLLALAEDERVVQELEGLKGRGRLVAHGGQLRGVGRIECVEKRVGERAENEAIDASPARAGAGPVVLAVVDDRRDVHAGPQRELLDRRAPHRAGRAGRRRARIASWMLSASSRRRFCRQSHWLSPSIAANAASCRTLCR